MAGLKYITILDEFFMKKINLIIKKISTSNRRVSFSDPLKILAEFFNEEVIYLDKK